MTFLHPEFLFFMLPILALLFSMLLTQEELTERFFSADVLKKLYVNVDQFSVKTRNAFYLLMFFFLILALASPVIERGHAVTLVEEDTFYIAIESAQKDFPLAQATAMTILSEVHDVNVGLLIFEKDSYLISPPTKDYMLLEGYIKTMEANLSGEASYETLMNAVDFLMKGRDVKSLVVLGDMDFVELTLLTQKKGIKLLTKEDIDLLRTKSEEKPIYFHLFLLPISLAMIMLIIATSSFYRGESYAVPILLLGLLGSSYEPLHAELLSYKILEKADSAYTYGDYEKSAKTFEHYGLNMESKEAIYNAANSYYKAKKYKKALVLYQSIHFVDANKNYALYYNIGNTLVALGTKESLQEALVMYKKALHFKEERETRENLQWVEGQLKRVQSRVYNEDDQINHGRFIVKKSEYKSEKRVARSLYDIRARYYKIELKE